MRELFDMAGFAVFYLSWIGLSVAMIAIMYGGMHLLAFVSRTPLHLF